jgi:hypothetical protein
MKFLSFWREEMIGVSAMYSTNISVLCKNFVSYSCSTL